VQAAQSFEHSTRTETNPKEAEREAPVRAAPKTAVLEAAGLLLLSLATVGTAWCSYQAAGWGGAAGGEANKATAASRRAAVAQLQAYQVQLVDVLLFSEYINARASSNEALARFYSDRFRGEAKAAFDGWMAMKPFDANSTAPPHPFVTNLYRPRLLIDAQSAEAESQRFSERAGEAGRVSRNYVLITVLLACALFCGGTASKFEQVWIRRGVLVLGVALFVFAGQRLVLLPLQF
jgi:hypothetical protein